MFNYEIKRDYFHCSSNQTIVQNLHVHKFFQIIVINQDFNKMKIIFQIMFSMFETHHYYQ